MERHAGFHVIPCADGKADAGLFLPGSKAILVLISGDKGLFQWPGTPSKRHPSVTKRSSRMTA